MLYPSPYPRSFRISEMSGYPVKGFRSSDVFTAATPAALRQAIAVRVPGLVRQVAGVPDDYCVEAVAHVHDREGIECRAIGWNFAATKAFTFRTPFLTPEVAEIIHLRQPVTVAGILKMKYGLMGLSASVMDIAGFEMPHGDEALSAAEISERAAEFIERWWPLIQKESTG
jgi:hypothetical protein